MERTVDQSGYRKPTKEEEKELQRVRDFVKNKVPVQDDEKLLLNYFREHQEKSLRPITMQNIRDISEILDIAEYDMYVDTDTGKLTLHDGQLDEYDNDVTPEDIIEKADNLVREWENAETIIQDENIFIRRFRNFYESDGTYSLDLNSLYHARIESEESDYPKLIGNENAKRVLLANGYIEKTEDEGSEYYDLYSNGLVCMDGETVTFKGYNENGTLRFVNEMGENDTEFSLTENEFEAAVMEFDGTDISISNEKSDEKELDDVPVGQMEFKVMSLERLYRATGGETTAGMIFENEENGVKYYDLFSRHGDCLLADGDRAAVLQIKDGNVLITPEFPKSGNEIFKLTEAEFAYVDMKPERTKARPVFGTLMHKTNKDGRESWAKYDQNGRLIYENKNGVELWNEYDENGNIIHSKDSGGNEVWAEYDADGKKIRERGENGAVTYSYDEQGNQTGTTFDGESEPRYTTE